MGKYSDKLVNDYIMGYAIENVDELENSKCFMMQAIEKSGDYKLYNLCSDKLKKNYSFVKYLILKFKDNTCFICNVADNYLKYVKDEFSQIELATIMISLTKNDREKYMRYQMFAHSLYYYKRLQIEACKRSFKDQEFVQELGMGFLLIFEEYNYSKRVLDFFAKKYIDGIFDENDIDLEYMLHEQFSNPSKLSKIGLNNYMLSFISYYDSMLASYLTTNIELMINLKNRIVKAINNWQKFEIKNERDKYNLMFDRVHEYLSNCDSLIDETSYLYYVGGKLGIIDTIFYYDLVYASLNEALKDIDTSFIKEALEISFEEKVCLYNVKKIMVETLFSKTSREIINKNKIIKLNFKEKRKDE